MTGPAQIFEGGGRSTRCRLARLEGDELLTYALASLVWQMNHMSDDYMYDND